MLDLLPFRHIVVADFEFEFGGHASPEEASRSGERPRPVCMVAKELRSGRTWRVWRGEFGSAPPFPTGPDSLFIAYYASAELGCFRALEWPKPANILDLFVEFRVRTNGMRPRGSGNGLVNALVYFGLDTIGSQEKDALRSLILRGGPWSADEREAILVYCQTDTDALERLLPAMVSGIDLPRALLRGRYMAAAAAMEWNGTPIDVVTLLLLREHWAEIQDYLIQEIDASYGVFDRRSFRSDLWERFLTRHNIPWPQHENGHLDLGSDTFREMAKSYPIVAPVHELRHALSQMRLEDLAVGHDGRNRTILSAFRSQTGRNQPSNTGFIFGPSVWLRGLIKPPPGYGVAYIDWKTQEFAIAAVLSGDEAMLAAYESGDVYLYFGKQVGVLPADATEESHEAERQLCKQCVLGIGYGMEERTLALRIRQPPIVARDLLRAHRETYRKFWDWSGAAVDHALLRGSLHTVFGWRVGVGAGLCGEGGRGPNPRSLRNFPMQANGAEMLRVACCLATERGIDVCAPVHDAIVITAPLDRLEDDIARTRGAMAEASRIVLGGFEVRTDVKAIRYPDRFMDKRGTVMWHRVTDLVARRLKARGVA
jgi:DNA polymerase-1